MNTNTTITIKILCYRNPVCYSVWRIVQHVINQLTPQFPDADFKISMIRDTAKIANYTHNLVLPSVVIDEMLVCQGHIPSQQEVLAWLQVALVSRGYQPFAIRDQ